jgi:hypothetical protein
MKKTNRPRRLRSRPPGPPRPRITVHVSTGPEPLGTVDMTGPGSEQTKVTATAGTVVKVRVGDGLEYSDLPQTIALARQIRNVQAIEIHGATRDAVDRAVKVFTAVFALLDEQDRSGATEEAMHAKWSALMLALTLSRLDRE